MGKEKEQKSPSKVQLLRRIQHSPLHLDRTKDTRSIYFSDKGLRLTVDDGEGYALVATLAHTHYFQKTALSGISRPFLYVQRFVDIALNNDCKADAPDGGYSYAKLLATLKAKEDQGEYNIAVFVDWWLFNIYQPLYSIGESSAESFLVYESYLHNIARNGILLEERKEDMTGKDFVERVTKQMADMASGLPEDVVFPKRTDSEMLAEEIDALQTQAMETLASAREEQMSDKENE